MSVPFKLFQLQYKNNPLCFFVIILVIIQFYRLLHFVVVLVIFVFVCFCPCSDNVAYTMSACFATVSYIIKGKKKSKTNSLNHCKYFCIVSFFKYSQGGVVYSLLWWLDGNKEICDLWPCVIFMKCCSVPWGRERPACCLNLLDP